MNWLTWRLCEANTQPHSQRHMQERTSNSSMRRSHTRSHITLWSYTRSHTPSNYLNTIEIQTVMRPLSVIGLRVYNRIDTTFKLSIFLAQKVIVITDIVSIPVRCQLSVTIHLHMSWNRHLVPIHTTYLQQVRQSNSQSMFDLLTSAYLFLEQCMCSWCRPSYRKRKERLVPMDSQSNNDG